MRNIAIWSSSGKNTTQRQVDLACTYDATLAVSGQDMTGVAYGLGKYVATGIVITSSTSTHQIKYSSDGVTWTNALPSTNYSFKSIAFGNGIFLALGGLYFGQRVVYGSTDGVNWFLYYTFPPTGSSVYDFMRIRFLNGKFYVGIQNNSTSPIATGYTYSSTNGITWTLVKVWPDSGLSNNTTIFTPYDMAYGGGTYVAVGVATSQPSQPAIYTSPDGITWTGTSVLSSVGEFTTISYIRGEFIALGLSGLAYKSSNGTTWTSFSIKSGFDFRAIEMNNGVYCAIGSVPSVSVTVEFSYLLSTDLTTWTEIYLPSNNSNKTYKTHYCTITVVNQQFYFSYGDWQAHTLLDSDPKKFEKIASSRWSPSLAALPANTWRELIYGGGKFVLIGSSGTGNRVWSSVDGISWTVGSIPDYDWRQVCYGNGVFVAISMTAGTGNQVATSTDAITWTMRTSAADRTWQTVNFNGTNFCAAGGSSLTDAIMTSSDGISWTQRTCPVARTFNYGASGDGIHVLYAFKGTQTSFLPMYVVVSLDNGVSWVEHQMSAGSRSNVTTFTHGNGRFSTGGINGTSSPFVGISFTSTNGTTWSAQSGIQTGHTNTFIGDMSLNSEICLMFGSGSKLYRSFTGAHFSWVPATITGLGQRGFTGRICYGAGRIVGVDTFANTTYYTDVPQNPADW
jgi:hypothetical protein